MDHYRVASTAGIRMWHADDKNHAVEQHNMDFFDETIIEVVREGACNCKGMDL